MGIQIIFHKKKHLQDGKCTLTCRCGPKEAVADTRITEDGYSSKEHQRADGTWFAFQEEARKVEQHEHHMVM